MENVEISTSTDGARFTVCKADSEISKTTLNRAVDSPLSDGNSYLTNYFTGFFISSMI